ncbi:MAG TPA: hemerythrin domain-containing protein [Thermoanaerobaculia bacterium]|nr:hemerythrin domain-containing protein [Thermoanaerobaculia bacterium]
MRRTTEAFRQEHVEIRKHLAHVSAMIGSIARAAPSEQQTIMQELVAALRLHIVAHAQWEERVLYPLVDAKAGSGRYEFTAAMRREHRIVGRWIDELEHQSTSTGADPIAFGQRADQLLGLILAHFEDEEEVLLPILDETMTSEEFEREVVSKGGQHPH